jgi:hypothetical protein
MQLFIASLLQSSWLPCYRWAVQNDERYHLFVELHHFRHDWQPEGPPF